MENDETVRPPLNQLMGMPMSCPPGFSQSIHPVPFSANIITSDDSNKHVYKKISGTRYSDLVSAIKLVPNWHTMNVATVPGFNVD